jgi:uncharacterized membrane protein
MKPSEFFNKEQKTEIAGAISNAEHNTSGEVRVHLEDKCKGDVLDRAAYIFEKLEMHKTKLRNGVLFYLAVEDRKLAILGDAGINAVTPDDFWDSIKEKMLEYFKKDEFATGLVTGIKLAGEKLKEHFPYQANDVNELSDDISYGKS